MDKLPALQITSDYDYHVTFNKNPDHKAYSIFYERNNLPKLQTLCFNKKIFITTIGVKELLFGILLKFVFQNTVVHSIHDWIPHPGKKYFLTKCYNAIASLLFELSFYSNSQRQLSGRGTASVYRLPLSKKVNAVDVRKKKQILLFGRNEPYKNYEFVNRIGELARQSGYDILIVAKQIDRQSFPAAKVINSFLEDDELFLLIRESAAVLIPYHSATQSGVLIKAYENGTPAIVSDCPGLTEDIFTRELGITFSLIEDAPDIWKKIEYFLSNWNASAFDSVIDRIRDE